MQIAYRVHVKITAHAYPRPSGVNVHWNIQESFATSVSESIPVFLRIDLAQSNQLAAKMTKKIHKYYAICHQKYTSIYNRKHDYSIYMPRYCIIRV